MIHLLSSSDRLKDNGEDVGFEGQRAVCSNNEEYDDNERVMIYGRNRGVQKPWERCTGPRGGGGPNGAEPQTIGSRTH